MTGAAGKFPTEGANPTTVPTWVPAGMMMFVPGTGVATVITFGEATAAVDAATGSLSDRCAPSYAGLFRGQSIATMN